MILMVGVKNQTEIKELKIKYNKNSHKNQTKSNKMKKLLRDTKL